MWQILQNSPENICSAITCTNFIFVPFLQNTSGRLLVKLVEYLFWESFCVSLDKSVLFYRRWLMSRFSETFSNSCGFPQFSLFSRQLVFSDRKHFCLILTDLSNLSHIKWSSEFPFARLWFENCSYKTLSKNADAAVLQNRFS